jgi:hypothetical protein
MNKGKLQELPVKYSSPIVSKYLAIRKEADALCLKIEAVHKAHIKCSPGCYECCMDFRIFPVEFYSILAEISGKRIEKKNEREKGDCVFLTGGLCTIYNARPLICRTHGLPLLHMDDDEWQLSYCELNFAGGTVPEFTGTNTFPQDLYNSKLFLINAEFVASLKEKPYSEKELIPLRDLKKFLEE